MTQLVLAEDQIIVRQGLKALLEASGNFQVAKEADDGMEVLNFLDTGVSIDIVIADINMSIMNGITLLKEIKKNHPNTKVVLLSSVEHENSIAQAFQYGADAYLLKNIHADELIFALNHIQSGKRYASSEVTMKFISQWSPIQDTESPKKLPFELTTRETEVLKLIALGHTNQEISEKIFLSKRTVEGHRQSLIEKTQSRNTAALIRFAVLNGLL